MARFFIDRPVFAWVVSILIILAGSLAITQLPVAQYPSIVSTEVVDKYTVKFNMQGPDPTVLGYLAWSRYSAIIPKGAYDKMNLVTTGIGTGPFKLVEYIANDHVTYTRNKDFWKQGFS